VQLGWDVVDDAPTAARAGRLGGVTLRVHLRDHSAPDELDVCVPMRWHRGLAPVWEPLSFSHTHQHSALRADLQHDRDGHAREQVRYDGRPLGAGELSYPASSAMGGLGADAPTRSETKYQVGLGPWDCHSACCAEHSVGRLGTTLE
jgi:hypothetical protein